MTSPAFTVIFIIVLATCCSCRGPATATDSSQGDIDKTHDAQECAELMEELRALRQGPQPCSSNDDCTVWHNGEYWDGCPVEVNVKNAARLDELRAMAEATGCEIQTGGNCPARIINGCGGGVCGHNAALVQSHNSLTPEQEKALTERIRKMAEQAGITLDASTAADAAGNAQ